MTSRKTKIVYPEKILIPCFKFAKHKHYGNYQVGTNVFFFFSQKYCKIKCKGSTEAVYDVE